MMQINQRLTFPHHGAEAQSRKRMKIKQLVFPPHLAPLIVSAEGAEALNNLTDRSAPGGSKSPAPDAARYRFPHSPHFSALMVRKVRRLSRRS